MGCVNCQLFRIAGDAFQHLTPVWVWKLWESASAVQVSAGKPCNVQAQC